MAGMTPLSLRRRSRGRGAGVDSKSSPVIVVPRADFQKMLDSATPDPAPGLRAMAQERRTRLG